MKGNSDIPMKFTTGFTTKFNADRGAVTGQVTKRANQCTDADSKAQNNMTVPGRITIVCINFSGRLTN